MDCLFLNLQTESGSVSSNQPQRERNEDRTGSYKKEEEILRRGEGGGEQVRKRDGAEGMGKSRGGWARERGERLGDRRRQMGRGVGKREKETLELETET